MSASFIAERPLIVSPTKARELGLEEACMLALLGDYGQYFGRWDAQGNLWLNLDKPILAQLAPFWNDYDLQRISRSLHNQGVIQLASAPFIESQKLELLLPNSTALGAKTASQAPQAIAPVNSLRQNASQPFDLVGSHWQPSEELRKRIAEHHIPEYFIRQHTAEIVVQMRETKTPEASAGGKFLKEVLRRWRYHQTQIAREGRENTAIQAVDRDTEFLHGDTSGPMHSKWRPSKDALEVLVKHAGINYAFVEDAIPEFLVYWSERGDVSKTWNTKFINHVKKQWHRFKSALENDTEPRRIPDNWRPSREVFDVLKLAEIDLKFAEQQLPEFILFWRDSNQVYASWNTKFLQHVKFHWAKQHALVTNNSQQGLQDARQQLINPTTRTRDASLTQQLNDRSWAN